MAAGTMVSPPERAGAQVRHQTGCESDRGFLASG